MKIEYLFIQAKLIQQWHHSFRVYNNCSLAPSWHGVSTCGFTSCFSWEKHYSVLEKLLD